MKSSSSTPLISLMKHITKSLVLVMLLVVVAQRGTSVTAHSSAVPEIESFGGNDEHVAPLERRMNDCDFGCDSYDATISNLEGLISQILQLMTISANTIQNLATNKDTLDPNDEWVDKAIAAYQKQLREDAQQYYIYQNRKRLAEKQKAWCERREAKCERKKAKAARKANKN
eukprot:CAMPEP_0203633666 /NCGR_PEP_ID=MMETSP0088-20131115/766_1 /ASSEMBLY_ACC=CAM_ASM_001087 /TAXON_ID=426623 /ORGANISM="Chaetoceros affinis, Strain CCMP159" /LENGTH=171 /DNA_ID=CAMNT_0050487059 /DNA_START=31 /DNA_END=546 /DNA_ORIENTATION=-